MQPHTTSPALLSSGRFFQKLTGLFYVLMGLWHFAAGKDMEGSSKAPGKCCLTKVPSLKEKMSGRSSEHQMPRAMLPTSKKCRDLVIRSWHKICLFSRNGRGTFLTAHLPGLKKCTQDFAAGATELLSRWLMSWPQCFWGERMMEDIVSDERKRRKKDKKFILWKWDSSYF